jgi:hypothetical protein
MKRIVGVLSLIIAMTASLAVSSANTGAAREQSGRSAEGKSRMPTQKQALDRLGRGVDVELNAQGIPSSVAGRLSARLRPDDPVTEARGALEAVGSAFRMGPDDGFTYSDLRPDRAGGAFVRMAQTYKGIPVVGGELTVRMSSDEVRGVSGRFVPDLDLDTEPAITKDQAKAAVESRNAQGVGAKRVVGGAGEPVVYANEEGVVRLAIPVRVESAETALAEEFFVDAASGLILGSRPARVKIQSGQDPTLNPPGNPNLLDDPGFECGSRGAGCQLSLSPWGPKSTTAHKNKKVIILETGEIVEVLDTTYIPPTTDWFDSDTNDPTACLICASPPIHTGSYKAWLGGWASIRQDSVAQCVDLPLPDPIGGVTHATLSLWITITTDEILSPKRGASTGSDYLFVEIINCGTDSVMETLMVYNSFNTAGSFIQQSFDISRYMGSRVKVRLRSFENNARQTSFFIDDLAVRTF